jgi:ubiquinone/menaquinone biosynthesis C-methylase UbiE/uncharacterized protein YbaR (Trm112 family)
MKRRALDFLVCPSCKKELELQVELEQSNEIMTGSLECRLCEKKYPILKGVPRFVELGDYASSFGYQWNRFREVQIDSVNGGNESKRTLFETTGWQEEDYRGRLILDAGVGAGRFAELVAKMGGEIVGVDLTEAIDAAFETVGRHDNAHLIQADIFSMPFRDETFDMAYSIGVLHHTPDTRTAFKHVASAVKRGGGLAVYLYHCYGPEHKFSDFYRKLTTRLPVRLMLWVSWLAVPFYYLYHIPLIGNVLRVMLPISMHPDWRWRWLDTFDSYTPKYQWKYQYPEVYGWFRSDGFDEIEIFDEPIRMRGSKNKL